MDAETTETQETASKLFPAAEELSGAETILLVEDEAFVRNVTSEVLRSAGYDVLTAKNALEAGSVYYEHGGVELLLSDVILPDENGRVLAGRLRRENPELKILLVTGYPDQLEVPGTHSEEECLAKPFSTAVLLRRVREMLDRRGLPIKTGDLLTPVCGPESLRGSGLESARVAQRG